MGYKISHFLSIIRQLFFQVYLKKLFRQCGEDICIEDHFRCLGIESVSLGSHIFFNHHVELIAANSSITIGNYVRIGQYSKILTLVHQYTDKQTPIFMQKETYAPVIIDDDVWIGTNCVILPGVRIHHGSIVGAGAVVTKDVPANSIVAGVPARVIKKR